MSEWRLRDGANPDPGGERMDVDFHVDPDLPEFRSYGALTYQHVEYLQVATSDGRIIPLPKDELAECSMFFRTVLQGDWAEKEEQIVTLTTVTAEALSNCIQLCEQMHAGDAQLDDMSLRTSCKLLETATYLSMDELVERLSELIIRQVSTESIIAVYRYIESRNVPLARRIWTMILKEFPTLVFTKEYTKLSRPEMQRLLLEPQLNIAPTEETNVVDGWIKAHDAAEGHAFRDFSLENMRQRAEDASESLVFMPRVPRSVLLSLGGWASAGPTNMIETWNERSKQWIPAPVRFFERHRAYHAMEWDSLAAMHEHRCYVSAVNYGDGRVFVAGGFNGSTRLRSAEVFDIEANQWSRVASMHRARSDSSVARVGSEGRVMCVGGFDGAQIHDTVELYDPQQDTWQELPRRMNSMRTGVGAVSIGENVVAVMGGYNGTNRLRTFEFYDAREGLWHRGPDMNTTRSNFAVQEFGDRVDEPGLVVCGGFDGNRTTNKCERYDFAAGRWSELPPMTLAKSALRVVQLRDHPLIETLVQYDERMSIS
ncbi:unnamed protein product, partial [Mesorhabditis spiculigera]